MKVSESMESFTMKTKTVQTHLILPTLLQMRIYMWNNAKKENLKD